MLLREFMAADGITGHLNKYLFKVEITHAKGATIYTHEFFGATPEEATKQCRERFGPDADITYCHQTGGLQ
jgi:hypothetical protein